MRLNKILAWIFVMMFVASIGTASADTITINNGSLYTNDSIVSVNISSNLPFVFIGNLSKNIWTKVENMNAPFSYNLIENISTGDGVKVIDLYDNSSPFPQKLNFSSITLDTTPPIITANAPANGIEYYYSSVPSDCDITFTDILSGVNDSSITYNGLSDCLIDTTDGDHSIDIYVKDNADNSVTQTISYSVDGTPRPSNRTVTRSFSKDFLNGTDDKIKVTITINGSEPFFMVNETIPSIFNITDITDKNGGNNVTNSTIGNITTFIIFEDSFSYNLSTLSDVYGSYSLSGTFKDSNIYYGNITGQSTVRLLNPTSAWVQEWDSNGDGYINRNEVIDSIFNGYFGGQLSISQILAIIGYYFSHTYIGG